MRVRMIASLIGDDGKEWLPGTVHDASEGFARMLVHNGQAQPVGDEPLPPSEPLTTQVMSRDPKPTRKRS